MLVLVVVPIYNVEDYLKRCLDSIVGQTYKNLDIILVNDGSTDNSGKICDEYASRDNRIRVIHQENKGVSAARNLGVHCAKGDLITQIDSDDFIELVMIEDMVNVLRKYNVDVIFSYGSKNSSIHFMNGDELYLEGLKGHFLSPWGNICKTSLYDGILFPEGRIFEDTATMYKLWYKVKKAACLDKHYYHYMRNPNSITQTSFNSKGRFDYLLGNEERLNFAQMGGGRTATL